MALNIPKDVNEELFEPIDLTAAQERVWRNMRLLQSLNGGRACTQAELSKALGLKSPQGCASHFPRLLELGYLIKSKDSGWRGWIAVIPPPTSPTTTAEKGNSNVR